MELVLACKKCKKVFRKDVSEFEEADEHCPRCDNHYMIEAKTPETQGKLVIEFETEAGHDHKMFKDDREKERNRVIDADVDLGGDHASPWGFNPSGRF